MTIVAQHLHLLVQAACMPAFALCIALYGRSIGVSNILARMGHGIQAILNPLSIQLTVCSTEYGSRCAPHLELRGYPASICVIYCKDRLPSARWALRGNMPADKI